MLKYNIWNIKDKADSIVISEDGLTVTRPNPYGDDLEIIRAVSGCRSTCKQYWEYYVNDTDWGGNILGGVCAWDHEVGTYLGSAARGWSVSTWPYVYNGGIARWVDGYVMDGYSGNSNSWPKVTVMGIAVWGFKVWFRINGVWLFGGNPANGVNSVFDNVFGYVYPAICFRRGFSITANFGATPFKHLAPAGFNEASSGLNEVITLTSSGMPELPGNKGSLYYGNASDPYRKAILTPSIPYGATFSTDSLRIDSAGNPWYRFCSWASMGCQTNKQYWEITSLDDHQAATFAGLLSASYLWPLSLYSLTDLLFGYGDCGVLLSEHTIVSEDITLYPSWAGGTIGLAADFAGKKIWVRVDGKWVGGGDPEKGTNPIASWTTGEMLYPAVCFGYRQSSVIFNFGQTIFRYLVPIGFNGVTQASLYPKQGNILLVKIDSAQIKEDLNDFPVLIHLAPENCGHNNFDAGVLASKLRGANLKKISVQSDNWQQCFVEIREADADNLWFVVRIPFVSSKEDILFYFCYDPEMEDNLDFVGYPGEPAALKVYEKVPVSPSQAWLDAAKKSYSDRLLSYYDQDSLLDPSLGISVTDTPMQVLKNVHQELMAARSLLTVLGDYWFTYFKDEEVLRMLASGMETLYSTEYMKLLRMVLMSNIIEIPVVESLQYELIAFDKSKAAYFERPIYGGFDYIEYPLPGAVALEFLTSSLIEPKVVLKYGEDFEIDEEKLYLYVDIFKDSDIVSNVASADYGTNKIVLFWAMNMCLKADYIYNRFGRFLYSYNINSQLYQLVVLALQFFYVNVKSLKHIEIILNILCGFPFSRSPGEVVTKIEYANQFQIVVPVSLLASYYKVTTTKNIYYVPVHSELLVAQGQALDGFQLLGRIASVSDYKTGSYWYKELDLPLQMIDQYTHADFLRDFKEYYNPDGTHKHRMDRTQTRVHISSIGTSYHRELYELVDKVLKYSLVYARIDLDAARLEFYKNKMDIFKAAYSVIRSGFPVNLYLLTDIVFLIFLGKDSYEYEMDDNLRVLNIDFKFDDSFNFHMNTYNGALDYDGTKQYSSVMEDTMTLKAFDTNGNEIALAG